MSKALVGLQIGMSAIGMMSAANNQRQQMENLRNERAWNFHYAEVDKQQKMMVARRRYAKALSEKRAIIGMRGVEMATGSTLLELNATLDDLQEELYWIGRGADREVQRAHMKSVGQAQEIQHKYGQSLLSSAKWAANAYGQYRYFNTASTTKIPPQSNYNPSKQQFFIRSSFMGT